LQRLGIGRHVQYFQREATIISTCRIVAQIFNTKDTGDVSNTTLSEPCNTENLRNYKILMTYLEHNESDHEF